MLDVDVTPERSFTANDKTQTQRDHLINNIDKPTLLKTRHIRADSRG